MNAIGNVTDRVLGWWYLGPDIALHQRRDASVNAADAVVIAGATEPQAGHVEAVAAIFRTEGEHLLEIQPGLLQVTAKGMMHQSLGKISWPAGTGVWVVKRVAPATASRAA